MLFWENKEFFCYDNIISRFYTKVNSNLAEIEAAILVNLK